jgi:hypothetical protein
MVAIHRGIDGSGGELRLPQQLLPISEPVAGGYTVVLSKARSPAFVRLGHCHESQVLRVGECISSVGAKATGTSSN